jgi:hypothetical protein
VAKAPPWRLAGSEIAAPCRRTGLADSLNLQCAAFGTQVELGADVAKPVRLRRGSWALRAVCIGLGLLVVVVAALGGWL